MKIIFDDAPSGTKNNEPLTLCRIAESPRIKITLHKMQKPRSAETGVFGYTLFSDTGALGGFVAFIGSHCYFQNTILLCFRMQNIVSVCGPRITTPTQFYGTTEAAFFLYFLYRHWLVKAGDG